MRGQEGRERRGMNGREEGDQFIFVLISFASLYRLWKEKCLESAIDESILKSSPKRPSGAITSNQWKQVSLLLGLQKSVLVRS